MLEGVYEARNEVRDLVRVLEIRLDGLEQQPGDPARDVERRELLHRIAMLRDERLRDDAGALDALARRLAVRARGRELPAMDWALIGEMARHARGLPRPAPPPGAIVTPPEPPAAD
jgi:hypothetical protein